MKQYLFVYGTLKKGLAPPEIAETVENLKPVGEGFVYGKLYDLGEYPAAVLGARGESKIYGLVYEIPPGDALRKIDRYEEFDSENPANSLYQRKKTDVFLKDKKLRSWIYEYNGSVSRLPHIENGAYSNIQTT